jgi:hypothetical protein
LLAVLWTALKQVARVSINMKDIGSEKLPVFLNDVEKKSKEIF